MRISIRYFTPAMIFLILIFSSCSFVYKKHTVGEYYFIGVDTRSEVMLSYKTRSGNYIGKAPPTLIEYGYNDTFLVAKTQEYSKTYPTYYIINMMKDSELAHEDVFRSGPLEENEYNNVLKKLNIQMKKVSTN